MLANQAHDGNVLPALCGRRIRPLSRSNRFVPAVVVLAISATLFQAGGATAQWVDTRVTGPFVCRAEFPLAPWQDLLDELGQLQRELVRCLAIQPASESIELHLFRDKRNYDRYLKRHMPQVPYRRALYVKRQGPGQVFAYRSREFETDVRHECTHALLHAALPLVPLWLDEGLAEYFEAPSHHRAFENPHLKTVRWNMRLGTVQKLETLEKKTTLSEMGLTEYRHCWAWVHFMLHGPREAHQELVNYLADLQAGTPPGLLSRRLQRRLRSVRGQFAAHFKSWRR